MFELASQAIEESTPGYHITPGTAEDLGATLTETGCNFAVTSPQADQIYLCLFDDNDEETARIPMAGKTGRVWHVHVDHLKAGQRYGFRASGDYNPQRGLLFDINKLLIDPYAKALSRPLTWDDSAYEGDSADLVPKGIIVDNGAFDWDNDKPPRYSENDTLLYEVHVKGFTQLHPDVPELERGTYLGLTHPAVIEHLVKLGVTTVQLMPCAAFMTEPRLEHFGLQNYWGYNPINFFSPEPRYAVKDAVTEFKTMVKTLHQAGIEVIVDVVFNHTAEGGFGGPVLSYKGFDNSNFYLFERPEDGLDYRQYCNHSGCGNSVNVETPHVLTQIADALRYWVQEFHVDGFRFDLAASLAREGYEFNRDSAFLKTLQQDPVLRKVKLVAEPWDVGPGGYRLGQFPGHWHETNDKYRDGVRAFWRGDKGKLGEFATRVLGSRDVFHPGRRSIHASVNFICYHDGFTLEDLVSFSQRHNEANCEDNMDGHSHNLSANFGVEGPTHDARILALRDRQKRNFWATLLLSQGIPHLLAGDEMGRTQLGNNNAYCQDNPISWVNWQLLPRDEKLMVFVRQLIGIRRQSDLLRWLHLGSDNYYGHTSRHKACWIHPEGHDMRAYDWHHADSHCVGLRLSHSDSKTEPEELVILFNACNRPARFTLPSLERGRHWRLVFDTAANEGLTQPAYSKITVKKHYSLEPFSCVLLRVGEGS